MSKAASRMGAQLLRVQWLFDRAALCLDKKLTIISIQRLGYVCAKLYVHTLHGVVFS
jgi:hypothetical protein